MLTVDGSLGEGGGQVLRSALTLSLLTGRAFRIEEIRAGRDRPGLRRQHLTAVRAAADVGGGRAEGAEIGAGALTFVPGEARPGRYRFSTGGAGSATLVLQTVLPALLAADGPSRLVLEGGTHNPLAPPYEFLAEAWAPVLERAGPRIDLELRRHGFHPRGGGELVADVRPAAELRPVELLERGEVVARRARALVAGLPRHIAEREVSVAHAMLDLRPDALEVVELPEDRGPGNVLLLTLEAERVTEVVAGFGRKGKPAERVAREASREALAWLEGAAPVGPHLADQLLVPLSEAGGTFRTSEPTRHARTAARVVEAFRGRSVEIVRPEEGKDGDDVREVRVPAAR